MLKSVTEGREMYVRYIVVRNLDASRYRAPLGPRESLTKIKYCVVDLCIVLITKLCSVILTRLSIYMSR